MQSDVDVYGRMKGGIDIDRRKYLKVLDSRAGGGGACAGGARGNMEYIYSRYRYTYVLKCRSIFMRVQDCVCRLASVWIRFAGKNTSC
jgi:hypothetical protein